MTSEVAVDDGFNIYQPGTYEQVVNFTVLEKAVYPVFSSTANSGQLEAAQELVDALIACGGNAQITVVQDMKINIPYKVYADPELYEWFLSQPLK